MLAGNAANSLSTFRASVGKEHPFLIESDDDKILKSRIGTVIELPRLPSSPKGFENEDFYSHYLLTKQRFDLLKEYADFVRKKASYGGFVPSGPYGIGKSGIGYLLANYAFANSHFLVYIVSTENF